jgi:hypothetical protein
MEKTCGSIPLNQYILPRRGSQDRSAWIEHSPLSRCDWSLLKRSVSFWKVELVNLSAATSLPTLILGALKKKICSEYVKFSGGGEFGVFEPRLNLMIDGIEGAAEPGIGGRDMGLGKADAGT